jgi:hypothetical protein
MKLKLLLFAIILISFNCGQNDNKEEKTESTNTETSDKKTETTGSNTNANQMFGIKAAKIVFKFTGSKLHEGTQTLYFDDYGNTAVLITDQGSGMSRNHQTSIWKDGKTTLINHETKKVSTSPFRVKDSEAPAIAETSDNSKKTIGYEKMPDETVAGKTCEVWYNKQLNIKYYLWNKMDLKLENQGVYTKEATSVEEISSIPADVMEIPKDYKQ